MSLTWMILAALLAGPADKLGPADGRDLPPADLERVKAGSPAPDFTLEDLAGNRVTLSQFRGKKKVVLVFYRGYW
jgi:cytochrome oxidase Cu insertion factor (SCO1/SenC/PrrC family)